MDLVKSAETLHWSSLTEQAQAYISSTLAGLVEEVTKLITGLMLVKQWTCVYALQGLLHGLCELMIIHHKRYLVSENDFFLVPQQAAGIESIWTLTLQKALGINPVDGITNTLNQRSSAALKLYSETCSIMDGSILEADRQVIDWGLQRINEFLDQTG